MIEIRIDVRAWGCRDRTVGYLCELGVHLEKAAHWQLGPFVSRLVRSQISVDHVALGEDGFSPDFKGK